MQPIALIVTDDPSRARRWAGWLEPAGFATLTCPGRLAWGCPRQYGDTCPRRELADVALVDLPCGWAEPGQQHVDRFCTKVPDDGGTVFVHSCDTAPVELAHPVEPPLLIAAATDAWHRAEAYSTATHAATATTA